MYCNFKYRQLIRITFIDIKRKSLIPWLILQYAIWMAANAF